MAGTLPETTPWIDRLDRALRERDRRSINGRRRAAVAVVLRPIEAGAATELLLIERTNRPDDPWSGQMAFPGGRIEPSDQGALGAAIREAQEEVGLDLTSTARHIGTSDDVQAMARGKRLDLVITPEVFVFPSAERPGLVLQEEEVATTRWVEMERIASGELDGTFEWDMVREGVRPHLPCYHVSDKVVWGLTYMMLSNVMAIAAGGEKR